MVNRLVKVGLIGIGYWGKNHLRALKQLKEENEIDEIIVCDVREEALEEIKKYDGVEISKNWRSLVKDDKLDMVSIVSPSPFHYEMSKAFLLAGKDVLVEKPMALTVSECDDLIETAEKTSSGLMVGHIFRFHSGILELKKRIEGGEFGDILSLTIRRQSLRAPRKDIGVMLALGIHEVDLMCFLLGDKNPDKIFADLNSYFGQTEETALIIQKFGKTTAYSIESWIDPTRGKLRELTLVGKYGSASMNFSAPDKLILHQAYLRPNSEKSSTTYKSIDGGEFTVTLEYKEPLYEEIKHFVVESIGQKEYRANSLVGRRAVKMIEKAIESHEKGAFVDLVCDCNV